ncbi:MAG: RT0821/Lpp0805 family surface protein [Xanthobacteraceae bacterium]
MLWACALVSFGLALAGCSVSLPMGSLIRSHDDDQTASIKPPEKPPIAGLQSADWQHAKVALDSALDSDDSGAAVDWDNPDSGTKGSFAAIGDAYATDTGTCRGFRAAIDRKDSDDALQGTACAHGTGDWVITDVKPWDKS